MRQHKYERMDKGLKRGGRKNQDQKQDTGTGRFLQVHPQQTKELVIADAIASLERGETTDSIALRHNIPNRTLRSWLLVDEQANQARARFMADKVLEAIEEIEGADDPLPLARAREKFRSWSWLAERRLPAYYGQHTHVTVDHTDYAAEIRAAREARMKTLDVVDADVVHTQQTQSDNSVTDSEQS